MHQTQRSRYPIDFSYEKYAGRKYVFFGIDPVEKCTRDFPRCYVSRGKVTSL
jgi:hypothetical protein